jgi:hypothetical protein
MNRSVAKKLLLVIALVTLMGAGAMAQSGNSTSGSPATQSKSSVAGGSSGSSSVNNTWQVAGNHDCPYHQNASSMNASSRNTPASAHGLD